jgi:hypothetical protein
MAQWSVCEFDGCCVETGTILKVIYRITQQDAFLEEHNIALCCGHYDHP